MLPVFVPSFRGVSNGSKKDEVFDKFGIGDVSNTSNNLVTPVRNKMSTSMSSSKASVETRLTKVNQTRKLIRRKNGNTNIAVPNSSVNIGSVAPIKNSNFIASSNSLSKSPSNFSSFYTNLEEQNRPNFSFRSANSPQKIFLHKTLFSPYIYEPNMMVAFVRRILEFVTNIMRPFSST